VLVLFQFLLQLSFGLALAMLATSPRLVSSGYFRNNLYVVLGMNVLAALVASTRTSEVGLPLWPPLVAAAMSYLGAVCWLYERPRGGRIALLTLAAATLAGLMYLAGPADDATSVLAVLSPPAGGLLLGTTTAAMLLGHWYLNAPGMKLAPLRRLIVLMGAAAVLRGVLAGGGLGLWWAGGGALDATQGALLALRWLAGLVGPVVLAWMGWKTLQIPNTQSATGILYVGVIGVFLGETVAALLSAELYYQL